MNALIALTWDDSNSAPLSPTMRFSLGTSQQQTKIYLKTMFLRISLRAFFPVFKRDINNDTVFNTNHEHKAEHGVYRLLHTRPSR